MPPAQISPSLHSESSVPSTCVWQTLHWCWTPTTFICRRFWSLLSLHFRWVPAHFFLGSFEVGGIEGRSVFFSSKVFRLSPIARLLEHPDAIHLPWMGTNCTCHQSHIRTFQHLVYKHCSTLVYIYHRLHTDHFCTILSFCSLDVQGVFFRIPIPTRCKMFFSLVAVLTSHGSHVHRS